MLVLPLRIELRTSPLPRGCSTTELRQRPPTNVLTRKRGDPCHMGGIRASAPTPPAVPPVAALPAACFDFAAMIKPGKAEQWAARSERLSAALRENLKRRKEQARGRAAAPGAEDSSTSDAKIE